MGNENRSGCGLPVSRDLPMILRPHPVRGCIRGNDPYRDQKKIGEEQKPSASRQYERSDSGNTREKQQRMRQCDVWKMAP